MELAQLRYFQKVARTGSITQAAQELFVSQPTLSQSLSRLESSLGCPLFVRKPGKRLLLNDAGRLFLEKVERAIAELEEGAESVRMHTVHTNSQVTLASSICDLCSEMVLGYFEQAPNVKISQRLVEINSLIDLLLDDDIDFAVSPCPLSESNPQIESIPLYTEEMFAIVGPEHRFYGLKEIDRKELLGERFICNYSESDRNYLDMLFEQESVPVDIMLESNEPSVLKGLIEQSAGVAFVPARIVMRRMETGERSVQKPIRVTGYQYQTPTCISKKENRCLSAAASDFFDYVIRFCKKEDELVRNFMEYYFT